MYTHVGTHMNVHIGIQWMSTKRMKYMKLWKLICCVTNVNVLFIAECCFISVHICFIYEVNNSYVAYNNIVTIIIIVFIHI